MFSLIVTDLSGLLANYSQLYMTSSASAILLQPNPQAATEGAVSIRYLRSMINLPFPSAPGVLFVICPMSRFRVRRAAVRYKTQ